MEDINREKWLEVLEIIAQKRPDGAEAEWAWVMKELELSPEYFLGIYEAVKQGRWRGVENPGGYIKSVAKREARKMGLLDPHGTSEETRRQAMQLSRVPGWEGCADMVGRSPRGYVGDEISVAPGKAGGEKLTQEQMLEYMEYRQRSGEAIKDPDRVWRKAAEMSTDWEGLFRHAKKPRPSTSGAAKAGSSELKTETGAEPRRFPVLPAMQRLAEWVERRKKKRAAEGKPGPEMPYFDPQFDQPPEWEGMARQAGLSEWEMTVVNYKMRGVSREQAIAEQRSKKARRALQAAWKKLDRTARKRLKINLKKFFPRDVPEEGVSDTE